jgi:hypothetical protein
MGLDMVVTKERQRQFKTPLGGVLVCGLVNSVTHGVAGWHFMLRRPDGFEHYFSSDGRVFSSAAVHSENLVIGSTEPDREKVRLLRRLWEEYIMRLDVLPVDSPDVVTIG